ncbi:HNH endonuclease, partial [Listeria aquatica]
AAVSGKDWLTGREMDTSERVMRGAFSLLDIVPGMKAFSGGTQAIRSGTKLASLSDNLLHGVKSIPSKADDLIKLGKSKALTRINSLKTTVKEAVHTGIEKSIKGLDEVGKVADNFKNNLNLNSRRQLAADGFGALPAGGTSKVTNATEKMKDVLRKYDLNLSSGRRGVASEKASEANVNLIDDFVNGKASFDDALQSYSQKYAEIVSKNEKWSWNKSIPGGENLSIKQKKLIKEMAVNEGLIPDVKVTPVENMKYGFADFKGAGVVEETIDLPKDLWLKSDKEQFDWLNEQIGGSRPGKTWHHTEIPGKMELVDFGVHNITSHNGGRTVGMWADSGR